MNQDLSIVQLLLNASWVVQAVVLILMMRPQGLFASKVRR